MRNVNHHEVCEVETQVGDAGCVLKSYAVHVVSQSCPVITVTEQVSQSVKRLTCVPKYVGLEHVIDEMESGLPAEACPSFGKPVDSSGLESRYDCKLAVQVVKLVKSLGHLISNWTI